jgi:hypothetical protein
MSTITASQLADLMEAHEQGGGNMSDFYSAFTPTAAAPIASGVDPVAQAFGQVKSPTDGAPTTEENATVAAFGSIPNSSAVARADELAVAKGQTAQAFAAIAPRTVVKFFDGVSVPFKGMFSALAPHTLQPGQFSVVQDLRPDDGSLVARQPTTDQSATGLPTTGNSNFPNVGPGRGMWSGTLSGTNYVVGAWFVGTSGTNAHGVGVFVSTNGVAWAELTTTSGPFGNTRLTDTGAPFSFQNAPLVQNSQDYLIIQNGVDQPRVYDPTAITSFKIRVVNQFSAPTWASARTVIGNIGPQCLETLASATGGGGAGHITATINGSSAGQSLSLALGTSTASGDAVVLDFGVGGFGFYQTQQLLFASDQASANLWNSWKVEVSNDGSTYYALADPSSANYNASVRVPFLDPALTSTVAGGGLNGEEVVGFNVAVLNATLTTTLRYIRLTWKGQAVASAITTTLHGIGVSGAQLAFQQQYVLTYAGLNGMSESPGVVMAGFSSTTGSAISGISTQTIYWPFVAGIYYDHLIPCQAQSLTDLQNGCDSIYAYRLDVGASDAFFWYAETVGEYLGGAWVYTATASTTPPISLGIELSSALWFATAPNPNWPAPDAYAMILPVGLAQAFGNTRLFVGGKASGGVGFYAASESNSSFRFRLAPNPSLSRSATYITLSGETIVAFAVTSGGSLSANTVWMFSTAKTRMLSGFDCYSLSNPTADFDIGCSAPGSVAAYKDAIFWLDDVGQIRRFSYGRAALYGYSGSYGYDLAPAISKRVVSDRTTAIPTAALPWATGFCTFDRYYLLYTPAGDATNLRILVYDETIGCFVEDTLATACQGAAVANLSGPQLLLQGLNGHVYRHENPGSSAVHGVALTAREISDGMWNPMFFGRIGVVIDAQSGETMSVTKTFKPTGNTDSSSIDLSTLPVNQTSAPQMWRWDSRATSTQPGLNGVASVAAMSWTMTPGTRLYSIVQEVQKAIAGADQL